MPEQRLWAPWRLAYMRGDRAREGYIVCLASEGGDDDAGFVLQRGERCFAMRNAFAYTSTPTSCWS